MKNMKMSRNKSKAATITLVLVLTISATLITFLPTVNAADLPTYAFLSVAPNPVGVNQEVTIMMWLDKINPTASGPAGSRFGGFTVTITKPDQTTQTLGPFTADPASFAYALYTPDQIGTYTLEFNFPGQQITGVGGIIPIPIDNYYEASSFTTTLTVQEEPITPLPQTPLPTDYWTRPIDAQNQEWYTISGNWLGLGGTSFGATAYNASGNFNPYSRAPNSAHIVWTKPLDFGGLIGGEFGGTPTSHYYTGKTYEPKFTPPVIINGVLYYNAPLPPKEGFYAVDLRTGETLWWQNSTGPVTMLGMAELLGTPGYAGISCGQIFNYRSPNEEGARAYLWYMGAADTSGANAYYMYDANTGQLILTLENAPIGFSQVPARVQGPSGELLVYVLDGTNNWLALWNSTKAIGTGSTFSTGLWTWRPPVGATLDWKDGIQWNVTVPAIRGQAITLIGSGIILATTGNMFLPQSWQMEIAYDAETGEQLWIQNRTTPMGATSFGLMGSLKDGVYTELDKGAMQWYGYSASSGEQIWGPTEPYTNAWGSQPFGSHSAYGNLYARSMDGIHALDLSTGQKLWDFYAEPSGIEYPGLSTYPFLGGDITIADGKVFAATGNSHGDPLFRGAHLYAIDAMSGEQRWSINGFFLDTMPIADGYLVAFNGYDNQLYCFGKGKTATAVTASSKVIAKGDTVLIEGTVTDQSPAQPGTPCVSKESMSEWMEYLQMQKPLPMDATGVPVKLEAFGADGSYIEIGTVTSDLNGFRYEWTPPDEGLYMIMATFNGDDSYWSSYTATGLSVGPAPEAPPEPEPAEAPAYTTIDLVLIAVAVVTVCLVLYTLYTVRKQRK